MNSFGYNSKFLGNLSNPFFQVVRRNFVEHRGDEDIKWQWSVRESPCQECHKYKAKKGWLAKLFHSKEETEELTNRRRQVVHKPKIWEWEYYDYLLPECNQKCVGAKAQYQPPSNLPCGDPAAKECEGKRILVHLSDDHKYQKQTTEKFSFALKEPFSLNEVCCKNGYENKSDTEASSTEASSTEEEKKDEGKDKKDNFCCLNNLIDENKEKKEDNSKKSQCG